jgi:hypothetical protein
MKYLIENEKPSYKEPPKEVCFYAYKRINHLREILAQFQAKESTHIPSEVFENIKCQIKKERLEISDLTNRKTKEILKNLGYNKYYEHIPFIKDKLGIKPPVMSQELEETLCNLFMEIQKPYSKYCPKDRVNFLKNLVIKINWKGNDKKFLIRVPMIDRDWITVYKKDLGLDYKLDRTHFIEYTFQDFQDELLESDIEIKSYFIKFGEIYSICKAK